MSVIFVLIGASLAVAAAFLGAFLWAVRSGQFEDTSTPSLRVLTEEGIAGETRRNSLDEAQRERK